MGYFKIKKIFNDVMVKTEKTVNKTIISNNEAEYIIAKETELEIEVPREEVIKKNIIEITNDLPHNVILKKGGVVVNKDLKYTKTKNSFDYRKIGVDDERTEKVAVLVHCYFIDVLIKTILPKLLPLSKQADFYFNFIKTGDKINQTMAIELIKKNFDNYTINYTEKNIGRDINGQFNNLKSIYSSGKSYDYYLFLHTKKSTHLVKKAAENWTEELLDSTVGSYDKINNIFDRFENNQNVGMIGCYKNKYETLKVMFNDNKEKYNALCDILNIDKTTESYFIGGTFFWVRSEIIDHYFKDNDNLNIIASNFSESGLLDGDWHHAMERMYGTLCYSLGYTVNN
jgi:lipopolysaccharide biosynthesis protein